MICSIVPKNPGRNRLGSDQDRDRNLRVDSYPSLKDPLYREHKIWDELEHHEDPWPHFLIWESEWHARLGIERLRQAPFMSLGYFRNDLKMLKLCQVYPNQFKAGQKSLASDVSFVTAAVRQAKEYYDSGLTVSELTRPTLLFYSALMLVQAAAVALFGFDYLKVQHGHGLESPVPGVRLDGTSTQWPSNIAWKNSGDFVALYQIARWDHYSDMCTQYQPKFHILECLRSVGVMDSESFLTETMPLTHLLWAYDGQDSGILPKTPQQVIQTSCFEVPRVVTLFMILFWLGIMSRYHPVSWRQLLTGSMEEGHYFRRALAEVPEQFVRAMQEALPQPYAIPDPAKVPSIAEPVEPKTLQQPYEI